MFRFSTFAVLACCAFAWASGPLRADTVVLIPDRDNTLYQRDAGDVSNGAGPALFFGQTGANANNVLRRALMRFDLSSIPPGSTINNVELQIEVDLVPPTATGYDATVHRVVADWGEGASVAPGAGGAGTSAVTPDATWLHREFDSVFWANPGGDFEAVPSASTPVGSAVGPVVFSSSAALVADVQAWVDAPSQNFGWMIRGNEASEQNARRIGSRENPTIAPQLTIDFDPLLIPETQSVPVLSRWGLLTMALVVLLVGGLQMRRQ